MPAAEVEVSADLVRRLLADQHPDLVPLPVKFLDRDAVLRVWDAVLAAPGYGGPPVWLHGDLHPANVLVNDGQVSGVIDFGDITAGDPASDLSVAWMLLPLGCHDSFWSAW